MTVNCWNELIDFVRSAADSNARKRLTASTCLETDLDISGGDADDLMGDSSSGFQWPMAISCWDVVSVLRISTPWSCLAFCFHAGGVSAGRASL